MRGNERLKMGGKEEKRGGCRGESLIIYLPKNHTTTVWRPHHQGCGEEKEKSSVENTPAIKETKNSTTE